MIHVVGAGAIGLTLAARLARAGTTVCVCTRREEDAARIARDGIAVEEPETGAQWSVRVAARAGAPAATNDPVFACVRVPDSAAVADAIAGASPGALVVNVQNGVEGDAIFAARGLRVVGAVIRQGCTRVDTGRVRSIVPGRIVVGAGTDAAADTVASIAAVLRSAAYDVGVSSRIADDRWLKLCINLTSTPNALVRPGEHMTRAFTEGKARLLEEARDVLRAAGIETRSCDGRDRSLDAEIDAQRRALSRGDAARRLPIYNSLWQALRRGGALESDAFHRRIVELGDACGVATPCNRRALEMLERTIAHSLGPESCGAEEFFAGL